MIDWSVLFDVINENVASFAMLFREYESSDRR